MTPLRKRMEEDMRLRKLSERTREQYINCVAVYARHYGASPEHLGEDEVRGFLLLMTEMGRKAWTLVVYHAALRFLYLFTLLRSDVMEGVPRPRVPRAPVRRPLTRDEVRTLPDAAEPKPYIHAFLVTALATGLRLNELCNLRVEDIDADSGTIHVRKGKGDQQRWDRTAAFRLRGRAVRAPQQRPANRCWHPLETPDSVRTPSWAPSGTNATVGSAPISS